MSIVCVHSAVIQYDGSTDHFPFYALHPERKTGYELCAHFHCGIIARSYAYTLTHTGTSTNNNIIVQAIDGLLIEWKRTSEWQ